MKKWIIGVDIGGTKIAVSLGTVKGVIVSRIIFSSEQGKKAKKSIQQIADSINRLLSEPEINKRDVAGVGIGVPGAIDPKTQVILKSPNLPSWEGVSLKKTIERQIKLPVLIENDANAAALGEYFFGQGRGIDDFIYITVSTGIGSGIVANGKLLRGHKGTAGEVGHMIVQKDGRKCPCGKQGCLEAYGSGTAIAAYVRAAIKKGKRSKYFSGKNPLITGHSIAIAAKAGDSLAIEARELAADYLGIGIANVINLLNPKRVILGGGVMEQIHHFWTPMMKAVKRETWPTMFRSTEILRSKLGNQVGDLGAMALALYR